MAALYRRGGFGYGEVKKALADAAEKFWAEPAPAARELAAKPDECAKFLPTARPKPARKRLKS